MALSRIAEPIEMSEGANVRPDPLRMRMFRHQETGYSATEDRFAAVISGGGPEGSRKRLSLSAHE
jgi:hypothetical protein